MEHFTISHVSSKSIQLNFDSEEEAQEARELLEKLNDEKDQPRFIDEKTKAWIYSKDADTCFGLLKVQKLLTSDDLESQIEGARYILKAIDHIKWIERFFYPIIVLGKEE